MSGMDIVIDIGGTRMRVAGTEDGEHFGEPMILDSSSEYEPGIESLKGAITKVAAGKPVGRIAAGIAGVISHDGRSTSGAWKLPGWKDRDFAGDLEKSFGARVFLSNDTAQVGLGEAVYGAGKGAPIVVYITVSTGVNGARIVNGTIEPSANGYEIGGQYLSMGDARRTFEELVSGHSVEEKYGMYPTNIPADSPVWEELALYTAYGVHNSILHWSPHRVVLGGSMFNTIGIKVDRVRAHVQELMRKFPEIPEIIHSDLGDLGGLWGGLAVLKSRGRS